MKRKTEQIKIVTELSTWFARGMEFQRSFELFFFIKKHRVLAYSGCHQWQERESAGSDEHNVSVKKIYIIHLKFIQNEEESGTNRKTNHCRRTLYLVRGRNRFST